MAVIDNSIIQREPPVLQRIPPEIVLEIFFECLFSRPHHTLSIRQAPLNVSQTCRYWRNVALSSSKLWAHLVLCSRKSSFQTAQLQYILAAMNTWFLRSNKAPLSFNMHISIPDFSDKALRSSAEQVVSSLFSQQNRWKNIKLVCIGLDFSETFYLEATSMPLIESLQLRFSPNKGYYYPSPRFEGILDLTSSTLLKTLNCRGSILLNPSASAQLELVQRDLLRVSIRNPRSPRPHACTSTFAQAVAREVGSADSSHREADTPGLVSLQINSAHEQAGEVLVDFMQRSQPPLEHLAITNGCPEDDELLDILRSLPALQSLFIGTAVLSYYFLLGMTLGSPWGALCPALETIVFHDVGGWEGDEGLVAEMLVPRWRAPGGLKVAGLFLVECDVEEIKEMEPVRRCVEEGLQLLLKL
ncbi:hypothetical protein DFH11DRAFT_1740248 [Phellopilus nigrolimitatus]|nr:hypothetical protein DFH11DRAFT_1740248 [Phellopilus nigrolimitatus]